MFLAVELLFTIDICESCHHPRVDHLLRLRIIDDVLLILSQVQQVSNDRDIGVREDGDPLGPVA